MSAPSTLLLLACYQDPLGDAPALAARSGLDLEHAEARLEGLAEERLVHRRARWDGRQRFLLAYEGWRALREAGLLDNAPVVERY